MGLRASFICKNYSILEMCVVFSICNATARASWPSNSRYNKNIDSGINFSVISRETEIIRFGFSKFFEYFLIKKLKNSVILNFLNILGQRK